MADLLVMRRDRVHLRSSDNVRGKKWLLEWSLIRYEERVGVAVVIVMIVRTLNLDHPLIPGANGNCWKFYVKTGIPAVISEIVLVFIIINLLLDTTLGAIILLKGHFFQAVVEKARNTFQTSSLTKDCRYTLQVTSSGMLSCCILMYIFLLII